MQANESPLTGLGQRLLREGIVSRADLTEAVQVSRERGMSLVAHLVANRQGDPGRIAVAAAREFGVPALDLDALQLGPEAANLLPGELLERHRVLPLMRRGQAPLGGSGPIRRTCRRWTKSRSGPRFGWNRW